MAEDFVRGLDGLIKELKDLPAGLQRGALKKAIDELAVTIAAAVSQEAPVSDSAHSLSKKTSATGPRQQYVTLLSGNLKANIQALKSRARGWSVTGGIESPYYARFVEKGHVIKWKRKGPVVGHVPANAFALRGFEKSREWAMDLAKKTLIDEFEKRIARAERAQRKKLRGG